MSKKHLSPEVLKLKENLCCGYCQKTFTGSDSQALKVKYEKRKVYCSKECRKLGQSASAEHYHRTKENPAPKYQLFGPCPTCQQMFKSRIGGKLFCSQACYMKSDKFKEHLKQQQLKTQTPESIATRAAKARVGENRPCLQCGKMTYVKRCKSDKNNFCSRPCYVAYMDARFVRNQDLPTLRELPQDYEAFLNAEVLPCIVEGCNWEGKHLSLHCNYAHGIDAQTFKRLAGFNLSEGIVSRPLSEKYSEREHMGVALSEYHRTNPGVWKLANEVIADRVKRGIPAYISNQARENHKKSRQFLLIQKTGPGRVCAGCGLPFVQASPFGKAIYCTRDCRDKDYSRIGSARRLAFQTVRAAPEWLGR